MVRARQQTSARDAQHLRKLGSHSAHAPERGGAWELPLSLLINKVYHVNKEK